MLPVKSFSFAHNMFNKLLERTFIHIFGRLTCAERSGQLVGGREDNWDSDMKIAWTSARPEGC